MAVCDFKIITPITILLVIFGIVNLSTSSPTENDAQLTLLTARVDSLQSKMERIITQLDEEKILRSHLQAVNSELEVKINVLAAENQNQEEKINILLTKSALQEEEILILKKINMNHAIFSNQKSVQQENKNKFEDNVDNEIPDPISSPRLPPSSCRQLSTIGHYLDGIYLIANPDTNKIEAVFCVFGSSTLSETLYGSMDVKSKSVHFFVQRSADFTLANAVIPFDIERLNVGGAMNLATGVFTVPVNGIYHFEFTGMKDVDVDNVYVYLQVNGVTLSQSYATNLPNYLTMSGLSASLRLKTGDQIRLFKTAGILNDYAPFTHFTGWLVEEDLVLS